VSDALAGARTRDFFAGMPAVEASAANGFAGNRIDRRSEERAPAIVAGALADPRGRYVLLDDDKVMVKEGDRGPDPLFSPAEAAARGASIEQAILLGWQDGAPRLAASVSA